jgi:glycogen debranching enzyme
MDTSKLREDLIRDIEALKSPKGYLYAGVPKFKGLFGRDSLIASWQLMSYDSSIARNTLIALSEVQGKKYNEKTGEEPGKIPHEYYSEDTADEWFQAEKGNTEWLQKGVPIYFSIDSTPLYIYVFAKYFWQTRDREFLETHWDSIKAAVEWIRHYLKEGVVAHKVLEPGMGLESQSWKDGIGDPVRRHIGEDLAVVEVQGYSYAALIRASRLAKRLGENEYAEELRRVARKLKRDFNETFWNENEKYFFFGIDSAGNQIHSVTSNPGHLLFTGIIDREKMKYVVDRLFAFDMWTKYGIRTHSTLDPDFNPYAYQLGTVWPHDNWIIAEGLKAQGFREEYRRVVKAMLAAFSEINCVPELYGVSVDDKIFVKELEQVPCSPQAWSTAALLNIVG